MAIKSLDYSKLESPFPIKQIDKGEIQRTPIDKAFGNAHKIVAPRLQVRPIPTSGTFPNGEE